MPKIEDISHDLTDDLSNLLDKVASPASRAGSVVERTGKMYKENVDLDVIALQMTKNSPTSQRYTRDDVAAYAKLYEDSKTRVIVTKRQARALIKDQRDAAQTDRNALAY